MGMLTGKLVGMHFRPPAKAILAVLPSGAEVRLIPEPENEYDSNAVRVEVHAAQIPESQYEKLASEAMGFGYSVEEITATEGTARGNGIGGPMVWHLGYIDSKKTGMAAVFAQALAGQSTSAVLGFDGSGWPLVMWQQPAAAAPGSEGAV